MPLPRAPYPSSRGRRRGPHGRGTQRDTGNGCVPMTSLLGKLLPLFSGPRKVEDLFTEAVARLFERRPELCVGWLRSEELIPSGEEDDKVHPRVASQKWLGTLGQQDKASRVDHQIEVQSSTADEPEGGGVV